MDCWVIEGSISPSASASDPATAATSPACFGSRVIETTWSGDMSGTPSRSSTGDSSGCCCLRAGAQLQLRVQHRRRPAHLPTVIGVGQRGPAPVAPVLAVTEPPGDLVVGDLLATSGLPDAEEGCRDRLRLQLPVGSLQRPLRLLRRVGFSGSCRDVPGGQRVEERPDHLGVGTTGSGGQRDRMPAVPRPTADGCREYAGTVGGYQGPPLVAKKPHQRRLRRSNAPSPRAPTAERC